MAKVVEVEQVVITDTGKVFRNKSAKLRVQAQREAGNKPFARLAIAKKEADLPTQERA